LTSIAGTLRLVVADDHPLVSRAIREYLERSPDVQVVASVGRCADLDAVVEKHRPDLLLLDLGMEPGCSPTATIRRLRTVHPALKILIFSAHSETYWVQEMIEARVDGYVHKSERLSVLVEAVRRVAAGQVWFSHDLLNALVANYDRGRILDERERVLLQAIADGEDLVALSANLHISTRTAERYLARAIEKLGAHSRVEAVAVALRHGVIQ